MPLASSIVTIVGMGLMGGSLGMALVKTGACKEVRALVRRDEAVEEILARGAAHVAGTDARQLLEEGRPGSVGHARSNHRISGF